MGYIEDNLVKGEEIIYKTKLHWVVILLPAINLFILVSAIVFLASLPKGDCSLALTCAIFPEFMGKGPMNFNRIIRILTRARDRHPQADGRQRAERG